MSNRFFLRYNPLSERLAIGFRVCLRQLQRITSDRSAASAVEFAFIAPILLVIYLSSFEITQAYTVAGKVLKAAGTVADVVTRQSSVDKTFLSQMMDAAETTVSPNGTSGMTLKITGVTIDSAGNAKVLWSWDQDGNAPYAKGSSVSVPDDMRTPSSFLVHAEVSLPHKILLFMGSATSFGSSARNITISRDFFYRQRLSDDIPCGDCS